MNSIVSHLWIIPLLPLLGAVVGLLPTRGKPGLAAGAAIAALALSLVFSVQALLVSLRDPSAHLSSNIDWFSLGNDVLRIGWLLDPLTAAMCVMVSFVGLLIFIFSLGYMAHDENPGRFFCFLSLFASAMLGILTANSLLLLFASWEVVGLASYLLIGFWFHKPSAAAAAKKAFITTRIGDLGLLIGLVWLYDKAGTLLLYDGGHGCLEHAALAGLSTATVGGLAVSTAITLLIFCGAAGKSGQFPLHIWLPDAMEGPTPVSALIHAATMVAAGVFLMARIYPLAQWDQAIAWAPLHALSVIAFIGAITALLGALIAVAQSDIKRVLAFSTISQLGYMMLALGVGSWTAAIFHLLTHAFFKALLFLGAGSVIAAAHHEQDIRKLGGLRPKLKVTFATFAIGMMALSGVPFLFSGFWSKEAVLHAASEWEVSKIPLIIGLCAVVLTAFYMTRLMCEVFLGKPRSEESSHAHENPPVMTVPLVLLAIGAVGLGFLGTPGWPWLQGFLAGHEVEAHSLLAGLPLMLASIFLVFVGIGLGWSTYGRTPRLSSESADPIERRMPGLYTFLAARMGLDEAYAATFGRLWTGAAMLAVILDEVVWQGLVSAVSGLSRAAGRANRDADEGILNGGFNAAAKGLRATGETYSGRLSGDARSSLRALAVAFVIIVLIALWGGTP